MSRELVEKAKHGDREAFEALAARLVRRLFTTANAILREPDLANDAVQDALIDVWRNLRALRDPGSLEAWAHRSRVLRVNNATNAVERVFALTAMPPPYDMAAVIAESLWVIDVAAGELRMVPLGEL